MRSDRGLLIALSPVVRLVDQLNLETLGSHADVDNAAFRIGPAVEDYRRYLIRTFGFVAPVERAINKTPSLAEYVDPRRFKKEELLRRDLAAVRLTTVQIDDLPLCPVPAFEDVYDALGWGYFTERSTLTHNTIFIQLASTIPGEIAFASSYVKCYAGSVGEMWRSFGESLDLAQRDGADKAQRVVDAAKHAFHAYKLWARPT